MSTIREDQTTNELTPHRKTASTMSHTTIDHESRHLVPGERILERLGYATKHQEVPSSPFRFPDGGLWRVEIPSVEGPDALSAVLATARELDVPIHRVSQGSGVTMLTDAEILRMVELANESSVELCLFVRPGANWDTGASRDSLAGSLSARSRGQGQLAAGIAEAQRAASLGVRSLLVADEGLLYCLHRMREEGDLPPDTQLKVSVLAAPANPASLHVQEMLGADTVNLSSDTSIAQLAEFRALNQVTFDFYVEAPDNVGGFVRLHEIPEIIRVAAPVYIKFGLRNAPDIYPSGGHMKDAVIASSQERVRRARLGLDALSRSGATQEMSPLGSRAQLTLTRRPR